MRREHSRPHKGTTMPHDKVALVLAALLALTTTPTLGAENIIEEVTVVAKRRMPLASAPATVTIIGREQIATTLSSDIRDLVRYEPGVTVRNDPVRFGVDSFAIRGVGGDRVAAEIDGVAVAESFSVGVLADSGRIFTDMDFIERVEILRGPASALYGSDAIGGVVLFHTLDPDDLLEGRSFASQWRAGYRGDTDGWSASALNAWDAGRMQLLLGYAHRANQETDIAGPLKPNPRDSRSDQALGKLILPQVGGGPLEITLEAGRVRDRTRVDALLGVAPRFTNTTAMRGDDTAERVRLGLEHSLQPDNRFADEIVWRIHAQRTDTEQITDERRRAAPPRSPPVELQRAFRLEDELAGAELIASRTFGAGAWSHELVYGAEIEAGRVTELRDGYQRDLDTGVVSTAILGEVFPLRDFPITRRIEAGLYVQDEMRSPNGRWRITPGLRFDVYRLRPDEDAIYREDNPSARAVALDERALSPKLAVLHEFSDQLGAFVQYARGFRSPPFEDVNIGLEIPLFNYRAVPNPDLRPETSDAFELGLRTRGAAFHATLSVHYTRFKDFIESRVNLGVDANGATLFQSRNIEQARMYGLEFDGRLDLGVLQPDLAGWSVALNAAWARGEDTVADQPLNSVEPAKAALLIDYDAPTGWGARLAARAAAKKHRVADGAARLFRTDGYFVLDAFVHLPLGKRGRVNLGLANLTDQHYIEWIDVRGRAADDPLTPYAANAGRHGSVAVNWRF